MSCVRNSVADPGKVEFFSVIRPFSFFDFVEERFCGISPLRRIFSQARNLKAKTMVVEEIQHSLEIAQENEDIETRYKLSPVTRVFRLSFFSKKFSTVKGLSSATDHDFIGYAVIKSDRFSREELNGIRVFESVLHTSSYPNNCVKNKPVWLCEICGFSFRVEGYIYAQQNNMTNVCAHVALRSVISSFHPEGDISYREINEIVGIDHVTRKAGGKDGEGLYFNEMVKVLGHYNLTCFGVDYQNPELDIPDIPFHKFIYGSVESGYPSLLMFATKNNSGHVIPVFGHTFNEDTWVSNADLSYFKAGQDLEYIPSESWLSMYLAHDDNFGSNFCIPRRYLHAVQPCKNINEDCPLNTNVAGVISILPKEVKMLRQASYRSE
ncbi:MAG: hypothetical protein PF904_14245 [Kiritimatiellae bacterium]|jgi:hypothetical protein|nr:hypothetical protein [Kiritimatiellia bacterium]